MMKTAAVLVAMRHTDPDECYNGVCHRALMAGLNYIPGGANGCVTLDAVTGPHTDMPPASVTDMPAVTVTGQPREGFWKDFDDAYVASSKAYARQNGSRPGYAARQLTPDHCIERTERELERGRREDSLRASQEERDRQAYRRRHCHVERGA